MLNNNAIPEVFNHITKVLYRGLLVPSNVTALDRFQHWILTSGPQNSSTLSITRQYKQEQYKHADTYLIMC